MLLVAFPVRSTSIQEVSVFSGTRCIQLAALALAPGLMVLTTHMAHAEEEGGGSGPTMCEWEDRDLFSENDYAHSTNCTTKPPQGDQNDWRVVATGSYTNAHSVWVYTRINNEGGAPHDLIEA
jgi:hypothetical protein